MDLGLGQHTIIVTGGSSGIGAATVRLLLAEGAHVATCARDEGRLKDAFADLDASAHDRLLLDACDVLDADAVGRLVERTAERFGGIDGVVCNAGRSTMSTFATTTDAQWHEELDLKFWSVLNVVRAAHPHLRSSSDAAIVVMNAVLARQPEGRLVATSAARAGLLNLTRSLAGEFGPDGIRVNTVALGLVDTGQWRRRFEASGATDWDAWAAELAEDRGIQLGRLGRADEVAPTIALLLSSRSSYTTGTCVEVDGGVGRYV